MRFSIIIPIYNVAAYLPQCLNSVLTQSYLDWEAICVNDGSTDDSSSILKEFALKDKRIKVITQANAGTATARNAGLRVAQGDYIFFLDSDDWIEPDSLRILANRLKGEDILCFSGKRYFESTGQYHQADVLPERVYQTGMDYYNANALLRRDFAFVCVVLRIYNRSFLMQNELFFDDDISYEDNLWIPKVLYYAHIIAVISDVLYLYRIREGSKMQEVSLKRKIDILIVANRLAAFFIPKDVIDKKIVYQALTHHYQMAFVNATPEDDKTLLPIINWDFYRTVSRTKPRHRLLYTAMRISPRLFRAIINKIS